MFSILVALVCTSAQAGTLDVDLGSKTATIATPGNMDVALDFKAADESSGSWDNSANSGIAVVCADEGTAPDDVRPEQLLLTVGENKWALAPGSSVKFKCAGGKSATVTDVGGSTVGTFKTPLVVQVSKAKTRDGL